MKKIAKENKEIKKGHLAHRYMGVYAGDTGYDNGIFSAGIHDNLSDAIQAVKKGLAECWCEPYWGEVIDLSTGERIPVDLTQ